MRCDSFLTLGGAALAQGFVRLPRCGNDDLRPRIHASVNDFVAIDVGVAVVGDSGGAAELTDSRTTKRWSGASADCLRRCP
jgi:hypothetical protein